MLASVVPLVPRAGSFTSALAAFRDARLNACLTNLHGVPGYAARALVARTLLRAGDPERALAELQSSESSTSIERSERAMLRAVALGRMGSDEAEHEMRDARVFGISSGDAAREAEVEFYTALAAFHEGDIELARKSCAQGLECGTSRWFASDDETIPFAHVLARLEELAGVLAAADGRYQDQLTHARATLAILDGCDVKDRWQEAFALANLGALVRDFDLRDDALELRDRMLALPWTTDLSARQFDVVDRLSWSAMLRGEHLEALRLFRQASELATTVPQKIDVAVARAIHARGLGHTIIATEEFEHAAALSEAFDWNRAAGDSRLSLLLLAQTAAPTAPGSARTALTAYSSIRSAMSSVHASRIEARVRAEESYTHGIVLRAEGRHHASTERLQFAFATWERIGYAWRAARAALELTELDGGDVFRLAVRRELTQRPKSFFAERARLVA